MQYMIKSIHLKSILCFNFCSMCFSFFVFDLSTFCMICQHFIFFRPRELPAIQSKLFRHFVRTTRNKKSQKQTQEFYYSKYSHDSQKNKCQPRLTTVLEDNLYKEHELSINFISRFSQNDNLVLCSKLWISCQLPWNMWKLQKSYWYRSFLCGVFFSKICRKCDFHTSPGNQMSVFLSESIRILNSQSFP